MAGQEDAGHSLEYWMPALREMQVQCQRLGIQIPLLLHAGETLTAGDGTADGNVYDALLLGAKRIGHGFCLSRHPRLIEHCRRDRVAIEICPISNQVLRLCANISNHTVRILLANGVHCVIGSDDPGFWG